MVFKNRCIIVLWMKVALALEGLTNSMLSWTTNRCNDFLDVREGSSHSRLANKNNETRPSKRYDTIVFLINSTSHSNNKSSASAEINSK